MTLIQKALGLILVTGGGIAGYTYLTKSNNTEPFKVVSLGEKEVFKKYFESSDKKTIDQGKVQKLESFFKDVDKGPKGTRINPNRSFVSSL